MQYNFSHYSMTNLQPVPEQWLQNARLTNFWEFCKTSSKTLELPEKLKLPDKRGFELKRRKQTAIKNRYLPHLANPY